MEDVWQAIDGDATESIPNFSTPPTWLYSPTDYSYAQDPHQPDYSYNKGQAPAANATALGDYYGRLLAWYTKGGVTDECGIYHESGHHYNITIWEVYNEVIHEHAQSKESYVQDFDAIVAGIRRWADPEHRIRFVGINHANVDSEQTVQEWAEYFLDPENHEESARDALDFIAYHSYPTNAGYSSDPASFALLFEYIDGFVNEVVDINAMLTSIAPATKVMLDECGTTAGAMVPDKARPLSQPLYWVASGSSFVYLYLRVAALQGNMVPVVGMSQLMDDDGQEPGVSMIDWTTGKGTARYWALRLLREACNPGDAFVPTSSNSPALFAQGLVGADGGCRLVMVNRGLAPVVVDAGDCTARIVDEASGEEAPRQASCQGLTVGSYGSAVATYASCPDRFSVFV